jgi:hypothetical protein
VPSSYPPSRRQEPAPDDSACQSAYTVRGGDRYWPPPPYASGLYRSEHQPTIENRETVLPRPQEGAKIRETDRGRLRFNSRVDEATRAASALFEEAVGWLRENYGRFEFWVERDVVWTLQTRLRAMVGESCLPFTVLSDYGLLPGPRRSLSADLVIRDAVGQVLVAAEFKYEPSHLRLEFQGQPGKLPVVFWGADGVAKDVARIRQFVEAGAASAAFALFLDEGRYFRARPPHPGSAWRDWNSSGPGNLSPAVLWSQWPSPDAAVPV